MWDLCGFIVSNRIVAYYTVSYRIKLLRFSIERSLLLDVMATILPKKWLLKATKNKEKATITSLERVETGRMRIKCDAVTFRYKK